ncbi:glycosyltransferase family 4 protein [bacterium]|nr:glycosyltransferase family 4 protein [bacterium]
MKVGMMTAWNEDAGPAICAELIGRQWVKEGHRARIFSYTLSDFHGRAIVAKDEDYVHRCFSTAAKRYLDPGPILESKLDLFVVQDLGMLPMDELAKIFPLIKRSAKTVNVIHGSGLSSNPSFYQFDWDRIVCFDERYKRFLTKVYPSELIEVIPHPLQPWMPGDKGEARKRLNLPPDGYILLVFGQALDEKLRMLGSLRELSKKHNILLLIVSLQEPGPLKENGLGIEVRKESPDLEKLYDYLYAVDALIMNKGIREEKVVVSTTAYQCLGSGCPILAYDSNLVETIPNDVIIKYRNFEEFEENLVSLFEDEERVKRLNQAQEDYVRENSPDRIAKAYLELFKEERE